MWRPATVSSAIATAATAVVLTVVVVLGVLLVTSTDPALDASPGTSSAASSDASPDAPAGTSTDTSAGGDDDPLVVTTAAGAVRGRQDGDLRTWRAVPYAAAPVGDLRWRAPQAPEPWRGIRDVRRSAAPCLQPADYEFAAARLSVRSGSSEDCLFLDVTAPAAATAGEGAPVIVWLHGGGLFEGSGSTVDPTALAERGVVVVTVNYRLGRLGYFAHPSLDQDVANFGLLDQMAALQWVRDTIDGFGGDPTSVTVMGGSAGAISVNALMAAPSARGLFDRAISQSAPGDAAARTLADVRRQGGRDFPSLTARQLRALPASATLSSTFNVLLGDAPILDAVLPVTVAETFAAGEEAPVPYLVGTTDAEFSDGDVRAFGADPVALRSGLGGPGHAALVAAYGRRDFAAYALDDLIFHAPAVSLALEHAVRAPTFRYRFQADPGGSTHGAEVPYVFGSEARPGRRDLTEAMGDYWVAFARTGVPRVVGLPAWPRAAGTAYLELGEQGPRPVTRDPWAQRLAALYDAVPLRLPASAASGLVSAARGR